MNNYNKRILFVFPLIYSLQFIDDILATRTHKNRDFKKSFDVSFSPPLGILYLAGVAKEMGYQPYILDLHKIFCQRLKSETFSNLITYDFCNSELKYKINQIKPAFVAISSIFSMASSSTHLVAKAIKSIDPTLPVIVGGGYPTNQMLRVLNDPNIDFIIIGEGEGSFRQFLQSNEVRNKKYIEDNPALVSKLSLEKGIVPLPAVVEEMDSLPFPAWECLDSPLDYIVDAGRSKAYDGLEKRTISLFTTRGCPYRCTFCASHTVHGRKLRYHSLDRIFSEIRIAVERYDINNLTIEDDLFIFSKERTIEFCKRLVQEYPGRFSLEFPNGVSTLILDDDVVKWLKRAGMSSIYIAIESGNQYVQDKIIKKRLNLKNITWVIKILNNYNILIRTFFIIGFPGETKEMIQDTIEFAKNLDVDWNSFFIFTPLPGSELYKMAKEGGYLDEKNMDNYHYLRGNLITKEYDKNDIEEIQYDANIRINFLNNRNLHNKRFDRAKELFGNIVKKYPNHIIGIYCYWLSLMGQNKLEKAKEQEERLKELCRFPIASHYLEKYQLKDKPPFLQMSLVST